MMSQCQRSDITPMQTSEVKRSKCHENSDSTPQMIISDWSRNFCVYKKHID